MNISLPVLSKKPIDLLKVNCQKVMTKINQEYTPTRTNFYSPTKLRKKKSQQQFTFSLQHQMESQPLISDSELKLPEIHKGCDLLHQGYKLHLEVQKTDHSPVLSLNKWQGPQKQSPSPVRRSTKLLPPINNSNLKQRNSQSLMILRSQQLEEMKKLQRLIKDVITRQDYQMNHHFDSLQQELSL